jgi:ribonucleoside-triphosphate reductase
MAIKNKQQYADIFTQGVEGSYYYTNMITPPNQELTFTERIRAEENLLAKFSGGTVHRIYFGEGYLDSKVVAKIIERIAKYTRIPYFDIAPSYSICEKCGTYHAGVVETCGECSGGMITYDRIVGYYRPRRQANSGKYQEILERRSALLKI